MPDRRRRSMAAPLRAYVLALVLALLLLGGSSQAAPALPSATTATDLSSGESHSCAVLSDGSVKCWGWNYYGQIGDATNTDRSSPVAVSGIATATQISAGRWHSCARLSDGTVKCWGYNFWGGLGDGTTTNTSTPVLVQGITTATQVAAGRYHSCARLTDSTVKCWGSNGSGQLGDGSTTDHLTPVAVSGITTAVDVTVGELHSCARLSNNTVKCWGYNGDGELGDGSTTQRLTPVSVSGISTATQISSATFHTCARLSTSAIRCWGSNTYGQLGDGTTTNRSTSVAVSGVSTGAQVSAGSEHSCARLSDNSLRCWGHNDYGQLGDGSMTDRLTPASVSGISTAAQVDAGQHHSCARLSDGTLGCWGDGFYGQLGDATVQIQTTAVSVSGLSTATQIASGDAFACARLSSSTVKCWGQNRVSELGDGTTSDRATPTAVIGITNAVQVAAGFSHACAVLADGTVKCWGRNDTGQLGNGTVTADPGLSTPVSVAGIATATQVSLGYKHSCARLTDGTLRCWGYNGSGQLGDGTTTNRSAPVSVSGITTATQVAAGEEHSCARLSDSTLKCWGNNYSGQLGDGTFGNQHQATPVAVSGISTATQVAAGRGYAGGSGFSCARLSDSTLRCWGDNHEGQLGDGTTTNRSTPISVPGVTAATEVAAGNRDSCSSLSGGTLTCWGKNDYGQLGDGTTTDRLTPTAVSGISTAAQVSEGATNGCTRLADSTVKCWGLVYGGALGNGVLGYSLVPVSVALGGGGGPQPPTITTTTLPGGTANQAYSQPVSATGGTTPYSWALSAGALPPGLILSATGTPSATISGTPTVAGTYNFTVRVTDSASAAATQALTIVVAPPSSPVPNPATLDNFNRGNENPVSQGGNWATIGINGGAAAPLASSSLRNFPSPAGGYSDRVTPYLGGDMDAAAKITTKPNTNHYLSLFICLQQAGTAGWDGYELRGKVLSGTDLWEIRRVDNGVSTVIGSFNFEMAANGTMLLRRWGGSLEFWWRPLNGSWAKKLTASDTAYMWGMIGAGGFSSGALDDFGGGSLLSLLEQYRPELRYDTIEGYRSDSAGEITDSYVSGDHTNELADANNLVLAAADPNLQQTQAWPTTLSLTYLGAYANPQSTDHMIEASGYQSDANRLHALPQYANKVYGKLSTYNRLTVLQYWFFYYYNSKQFVANYGVHEGDWEMVTVLLNANGTQVGAAYAQHDYGEVCDWQTMETNTLGRPKVFVSEGSHASYFHPTTGPGYTVYWEDVPVGTDQADGLNADVETPALVDVTQPPSWILWLGRWGNSSGGPGSPKSPGNQSTKWDNPGLWALTDPSMLPCRSGSLIAVGHRFGTAFSFERPPLPSVKAHIAAKRAIIDYQFKSFPTVRDRHPWILLTSVVPSDTKYGQYTVRTRIKSRSGRVVQRLGVGPGPYKLVVAVLSKSQSRSKVITLPLR